MSSSHSQFPGEEQSQDFCGLGFDALSEPVACLLQRDQHRGSTLSEFRSPCSWRRQLGWPSRNVSLPNPGRSFSGGAWLGSAKDVLPSVRKNFGEQESQDPLQHRSRRNRGRRPYLRCTRARTERGNKGGIYFRLFVFIGAKPRTDFLPSSIVRNDQGFVLTGQEVALLPVWKEPRPPCTVETSLPGVFAAGDCRSGSPKRVAFAIGDGAIAVTSVHKFLESTRPEPRSGGFVS